MNGQKISLDGQAGGQNFLSCLLSYASGGKQKLILSVILSAVSIMAGLVPYYCFYRVICLFLNGTASLTGIIHWSLWALAAYVVKVLCFGLSTTASHYAAYHILEGLRNRVAERFLHAPLGEVTKHSIGEIKGVLVDKIEDIEPPLAHMVPEGSGHIVLPIVSMAALAVIDWRLLLASLLTFPFSMVCMGLTFKISGKNYDKYNQSLTQMNSNIVEYVEGIEVIKAFGRTGESYGKFSSAILDYKTFVVKWLSSTWVTMKLAFALFPSTLLGVLPLALLLGADGSVTAAEAALAVMLSMSMVGSLAKLEVFVNELKKVQMTVEELQEYLEMPALPEENRNADLKGYDVELKNVRFSYEMEAKHSMEEGKSTEEVLHGISLKLPQGSFTALVGPSGSGKSTVARLISRFYDVSEGSISIGGVDIRDMPLSQLSGIVSFVAQDNFLFRCSIKENIRMGNPDADDAQVFAAARAAQCEEFIKKLPDGYDTPAGEAGKRLSGGEKQRIAIARMMLKDSPVIILDEATAFTDPENEDKIQKSIRELAKGKTLLVIAHRLSTIKNADNIVVLENGKALAQGKQEDLLKTCPLYTDMWAAHIGAKNWSVGSRKISIEEKGVQ